MAAFNVFTDSMRQPGTYQSPTFEIPVAEKVRLTVTTLDFANEPTSTTIEWGIDISKDDGQTWKFKGGNIMAGLGGVPLHKPVGLTIGISGLEGTLIKGYMTLNTALKFGVNGETY